MKDDGGQAFPLSGPMIAAPGMTLRDYFAAAAVTGLLAHPRCNEVGPGYEEITRCIARESYAVADAMLKGREK